MLCRKAFESIVSRKEQNSITSYLVVHMAAVNDELSYLATPYMTYNSHLGWPLESRPSVPEPLPPEIDSGFQPLPCIISVEGSYRIPVHSMLMSIRYHRVSQDLIQQFCRRSEHAWRSDNDARFGIVRSTSSMLR